MNNTNLQYLNKANGKKSFLHLAFEKPILFRISDILR